MSVLSSPNPLNDEQARRAFLFGVTHDGLKVWNRTGIQYKDIDALDEPQELKDSLKKYHDTWYTFGEDLPELLALLALFGYYVVTGGFMAAVKAILTLGGLTI
ncbi:MAG: hypothetical protein LUQ71_10155 [Methanoregula sp.]|nr:hypothetical protein [Methanoregula sp.]